MQAASFALFSISISLSSRFIQIGLHSCGRFQSEREKKKSTYQQVEDEKLVPAASQQLRGDAIELICVHSRRQFLSNTCRAC
jgi:hypothetical protein